ncbi:unnamed protein product [Lactuca saligna]|uniref:Uncharacterized protein n=1 Tax=Lactuca saligna TaxID=75948 RepID=A0AA35YR19_LACSI|nr:unnamed protein product [Lactuca saligna]
MDCVSKGRSTTVVAVWIRFGCEEGPTAYGAARESQQEFFRSAVSSEKSFSVKGIGSGDDILFLSWKPRAFVYHNILIMLLFYNLYFLLILFPYWNHYSKWTADASPLCGLAFKKKETVLTTLGPGEIASSPDYRLDVEKFDFC